MNVGLLFKIAAVGIMTAILGKIFEGLDRKELSTITTLAGLVIILLMVIGLIGSLFNNIRTMFQF